MEKKRRCSVGVSAQSFAKSKGLRDLLEDVCSPIASVEYYQHEDASSRERMIEFLRDKTIWLVGKEPVTQEFLAVAPQLEMIAKYGVGVDNIDFDACQKRGVQVHFEPGINADAVAELTIGLMLGLRRNIGMTSRLLSQGIWMKNGGSSLWDCTVGIVGFGNIGSRVGGLVNAFRCHVLINDILDKSLEATKINAEIVDMASLLERSDIVSLHVPLTPQTKGFFGKKQFELMPQGSLLINTSRGQVVDHEELVSALTNGKIGGAALDVFEHEPLNDQRLYSLDHFLGTPHIGGNSQEAVWAMGKAAIRGVQHWLKAQE